MSWDISLINKETSEPVTVEHFQEGGTQIVGGTDRAELNITYNYSWFYRRYLCSIDGICCLDSRLAKDCVDGFESAIAELGTNQFENYWAPTPGNAGFALSILLKWAKNNPEAMFVVK